MPCSILLYALMIFLPSNVVVAQLVTSSGGTQHLAVQSRFMNGWAETPPINPSNSLAAAWQAAGLFFGEWYPQASTLTNRPLMIVTLNGTTTFDAFVEFTVEHLSSMHPVIVGAYRAVPAAATSTPHDQNLLVIGAVTNETARTRDNLKGNTTLHSLLYYDWYTESPRTLAQPLGVARSNFYGSSAVLNPAQPHQYNIPSAQITAFAFVGVSDPLGVHYRTLLNTSTFIVGATQVVNITVSGLSRGRFFKTMRFATTSLPSNGNFLSVSSSAAWSKEFEATSSIMYFQNVDSFSTSIDWSYRTVEIAAPPDTPMPTAQILANATCAVSQSGVYSLDSSSTFCPFVAKCRHRFCTCLGAPDGNSCWILARSGCAKSRKCLADLSHCIDIGATQSTSDSCSGLRQDYNASLPAAKDMSSYRFYLQSNVGLACQALACDVFRQMPSICDLDMNAVCTKPNVFHGEIVWSGGAPTFEAIVNSESIYLQAATAIQNDLATLFGAVVRVKGLEYYPDTTFLEATFVLPNITTEEITTSTLTTNANTAWMTSFSTVYTANGGSNLAVQHFRKVPPIVGVGSEQNALDYVLSDCPARCVAGAAIGALLVMIFIIWLVAYCVWRRRENALQQAFREEEEKRTGHVAEEDDAELHGSPNLSRSIKRASAQVGLHGEITKKKYIERVQSPPSPTRKNEPVEENVKDN